MDIIKYSNVYKDKIINFLIDITKNEFNLNWQDYLKNEDWDIYNNPNNQMLILIDDEGEIIGTCALCDLGDKTGKLNSFYIKKNFRRKGYGKLLYIWMEVFINLNFEEVILCSNEVFKSLPFYEKLGFTPYRYETNGEIWCKKDYKKDITQINWKTSKY